MAIQGNKIMNLEDGQVLYNDLRRRIEKNAGVIEEVINTPSAVQTFDDGADGLPMALTVGIEPVQDLHGYDNPWPAGGGKNLLPNEITTVTEAGVTFTTLDNGKIKINGTSTASIFQNDICENFSLPEGTYIFSYDPVTSVDVQICNRAENSEYLRINASAPSKTLQVTSAMANDMRVRFVMNSGVTVSNAVTWVMIRLSTESDATFAPYSNICPIDGWTGAKVTRTGKNLYDMGKATQTVANVLYTRNSDGSYTATGTANAASVLKGQDMKLPVGSYKYSGITTGNSNLNIGLYVNNSFVNYIATAENSFTLTKESIIRLDLYVANGQASNVTFYPMIRRASETDGTYEPYAGQEYSITFPSSAGTVYGGTLTVNKDGSGVLTVDRELVKMNTLAWNEASGNYYSRTVSNSGRAKQASGRGLYCLTNKYKTYIGERNQQPDCSVMFGNTECSSSNADIAIKDSRCDSLSAFEASITNDDVFLYELRTNETYDLTSGQVTALLGINNIWADTGDINSVTYPADTKLYIDKKFAELSAAITALGT